MQSNFEVLIDKIITSDSFWRANYYFRSMKKQPHGGVARVFHPNLYLNHYPADTTVLFRSKPKEIEFFFKDIVDEALEEYEKLDIDAEEVLWYCFEGDFWYPGMRLLTPKKQFEDRNNSCPLIWDVISDKKKFLDHFDISSREVVYGLICFLIYDKSIRIQGLKEIIEREDLRESHNKYGLSIVNKAEFSRQGFTLEDKYYLYNIFFDTTIGDPFDKVPYTIKVLTNEINEFDLYMRCDELTAIPKKDKVETATMDAEKFRGITLAFVDIEKLINKKEIIVHYDPKKFNKIIMMIKPDKDSDGNSFYHIEVEQLWNPQMVRDSYVLTNYVHSQYYPESQSFNHIDFSVNQYEIGVYTEKFNDNVSNTAVSIDKYGDEHYKIWCVESDRIEIDIWSKLVNATLDEPFRELYYEMFTLADEKQAVKEASHSRTQNQPSKVL